MQRLAHKTSNSKCPTRFSIGFGPAALCACLATACTDYKSGSDTLEEEVGPWSCLGDPPEAPPLPDEPGAPAIYGLRLVDLATQQPFPDVTVVACAVTDTDCAAPLTKKIPASEQGFVDIPLYENFVGYLMIESPSAVPYIFHLPDDGLTTDRDFPLAMISLQSFSELGAILGVPIDLAQGAIAGRAFDCDGNLAEGVELSITSEVAPGAGDEATRWYFDGNLPTVRRQTSDRGGLGGFVNVPPGLYQFKATVGDEGEEEEVTVKRILVKSGWMTASYMRPRGADN